MNKIVFLLFVVVCGYTNGLEISENFVNYSSVEIAKFISNAFLYRLQSELRNGPFEAQNSGKASTLLPPFKDPLVLETLEAPMDGDIRTDFINITSKGHLSACAPEITGLSKISDVLIFTGNETSDLIFDWKSSVPSVALTMPHQLSLILTINDTLEALNVASEGKFVGSLEKPFFNLNAKGKQAADTGKLTLEELDVDLGFDKITLSAKSTVDGVTIPWQEIANWIKDAFESIWTPTIKVIVNEAIRCSINNTISDCTYQDIMDGKWECLQMGSSQCFNNVTNDNTISLFAIRTIAAPKAEGYCQNLPNDNSGTMGVKATFPIVIFTICLIGFSFLY